MKSINTIEYIRKQSKKKIILFGAGPSGIDFLKKAKITINYFIDNDKNLWGEKLLDFKIKDPKIILREKKNNYLIIITSSALEEITKQLKEFGQINKKDFIISPYLIGPNKKNNKFSELLVTTIGENGGLWLVETNKKYYKKILSGDFRGITKLNDSYLVVDENYGILRLSFDFKIISRLKVKNIPGLHGISVDQKSNLIFLNETHYDKIGIYDLGTYKKQDEITLGNFKSKKEVHHINDVYFYKGSLFACMFSLKGLWRNEVWNDGAIVKIDLKTKKIDKVLLNGLSQPHTIYVKNNDIFFCNSMKCEVRKNKKKIIEFQGYVRGIFIKDNFFYIGQSQIRRVSRVKSNITNISRDSGIHVWSSFDKTSFFINLPVTGVFDIIAF